MAKLFNARECYMIVESLKKEKLNSIAIIKKMQSENKRPLFTEGFIEREIDQLIEKVKENSKYQRTKKDGK